MRIVAQMLNRGKKKICEICQEITTGTIEWENYGEEMLTLSPNPKSNPNPKG